MMVRKSLLIRKSVWDKAENVGVRWQVQMVM